MECDRALAKGNTLVIFHKVDVNTSRSNLSQNAAAWSQVDLSKLQWYPIAQQLAPISTITIDLGPRPDTNGSTYADVPFQNLKSTSAATEEGLLRSTLAGKPLAVVCNQWTHRLTIAREQDGAILLASASTRYDYTARWGYPARIALLPIGVIGDVLIDGMALLVAVPLGIYNLAKPSAAVVFEDQRIVRKNEYSIGLPPEGWHGNVVGDQFPAEALTLTRQATFFHCPNRQAMILDDVDFSGLSTRRWLDGLPSKLVPDSFEGRALAYFERKFFLEHRADPAYHQTLISFSSQTASGLSYVDTLYKDRLVGMSSCHETIAVPTTYKERFIAVDLPQRRSAWPRHHPRMVVLSYLSPEGAYEEHLSDLDKWLATFRAQQRSN